MPWPWEMDSPGAKAFHIGEERWDAGLYDRLV